MKSRPVFPLIAPWILLALISGLLGGLTRIGWNIPATNLAGLHGLIMVGGFLGTVISFEKTLPLKHRGWLVIPFVSGLSVLVMIASDYTLALSLQLTASLGFVIVMFKWLSKTNDHYYRIMIIGALSWLIAIAALIAGRVIPSIIPYWMAFILFIIVGERLELTRFLPSSMLKKSILYLALLIFIIGIFVPYHGGGKYLLGFSVAAISLWLLRNDIVRISLKKSGRHQYIAVLLLTGYIWLFLSGFFIALMPVSKYMYDAMVHSFFLGFAFSMIFAHGPIIVPGIIKKNIDLYSPALYIWVSGFHAALVLRLAGDLLAMDSLRMMGGLGNAFFILCFFGNIIVNVNRAPSNPS